MSCVFYYRVNGVVFKVYSLGELKAAGKYKVFSMQADGLLKSRLNSLFIFEGKTLVVLYVKNGKAIISAGGVVIGLSRSVARRVNVCAVE